MASDESDDMHLVTLDSNQQGVCDPTRMLGSPCTHEPSALNGALAFTNSRQSQRPVIAEAVTI